MKIAQIVVVHLELSEEFGYVRNGGRWIGEGNGLPTVCSGLLCFFPCNWKSGIFILLLGHGGLCPKEEIDLPLVFS